MSFFEFPHSRTYDSDLGWLIRAFKHLEIDVTGLEDLVPTFNDLKEKVDALVDGLVDVIVPWDSSKDYNIYDIVEYQGTNYIAVKPVPVGTMITNTEYWQPANTVIEQINAIGQTLTEALENLPVNVIRPESFGAVGDGVADDTAALKEMLTHTECAYLLQGTYLITETLSVHGHMFGSGTIKTDATTRTLTNLLDVDGDLLIDGLTIDSKCSVPYTSGDYGTIYNTGLNAKDNAYNIRVTGCRFTNCYNVAIYMYGCTGEVVIRDCEFTCENGANAVSGQFIYMLTMPGGNPITIDNCVFTGTRSASENMGGVFLGNVVERPAVNITNCSFIGTGRNEGGGHQLYSVDAYFNVEHMMVDGCVFRESSYGQLRMHSVRHSIISNNYFGSNHGQRVSVAQVVIYNDRSSGGADPTGAHDVLFTGNTFENQSGPLWQCGLQITSDAAGDLERIEVLGCTFTGQFVHAMRINHFAKSVRIHGCTWNVAQSAVQFFGTGYTTDNKYEISHCSINTLGGSCIQSESGGFTMKVWQCVFETLANWIVLLTTASAAVRVMECVAIVQRGVSGAGTVAGCKFIKATASSIAPFVDVSTQYDNYINGSLYNS